MKKSMCLFCERVFNNDTLKFAKIKAYFQRIQPDDKKDFFIFLIEFRKIDIKINQVLCYL